jgi:hypothetical protein
MSPRAPIRRDIHERFITVVARAEAKLKGEQKAVERRLAAALAHETQERASERPSRVASAGVDTDGDDENEGEPSFIGESAPSTTPSPGSRSE